MSETRSSMRRYTLWLLIAVELLMSFSFFGYFHIEPISVTTAYIPVLLAGAEKVSVNSAAVRNPRIISDGAEAFGSQEIQIGVDDDIPQNGCVYFGF